MPPVVLFDFHETLVELRPSTDALFADIVGVPPEHCRAIFASVEPAVEALRSRGEWPPPTEERWALLYDLILETLELPGRGADVAKRIGAHFMDPGSYLLFPEVYDMLRALRGLGARVGILSNTDLQLWPLLQHLGLDAHVEVAVPAFLHGVEKPQPEAFALILEEMGANAESAWFVGDSLNVDVLPAAAVGMAPVLVDRLDVHPEADGYTKVRCLSELPGLVADAPRPTL